MCHPALCGCKMLLDQLHSALHAVWWHKKPVSPLTLALYEGTLEGLFLIHTIGKWKENQAQGARQWVYQAVRPYSGKTPLNPCKSGTRPLKLLVPLHCLQWRKWDRNPDQWQFSVIYGSRWVGFTWTPVHYELSIHFTLATKTLSGCLGKQLNHIYTCIQHPLKSGLGLAAWADNLKKW